jgi:lysophospholipase L1-like esterase
VPYVALGSSYASGPGIKPLVRTRPAEAGQSERNYAHLVARDAGLILTDVTSSGATTEDILTRHQYGQPPQIEAVTAETRLVTVTIGGNDVGLTQYLMANHLPAWVRPFGGMDEAASPDTVRAKLDSIAPRLVETIRAIQSRSPQATILFVTYVALLPAEGTAVDLTYNELAWRLAEATSLAASQTGARLIDLRTASLDHHYRAAEPWCTGPRISILPWRRTGAAPCHPNAAGMRAAAGLILADLATITPMSVPLPATEPVQMPAAVRQSCSYGASR